MENFSKTREVIKVRKPNYPKVGFVDTFIRYDNRWWKFYASLPNDGEKIKITWLPNNRGVKNAYIGFKGVVNGINKIEGTFTLNSGESVLICHGNFDYIRL